MENYEKEDYFAELNEKEKNIQLIQSILRAQQDLRQSQKNFEFAEEELIDFYVYQIKANQSKLDYLTKLAKSQNIENKSINSNVI